MSRAASSYSLMGQQFSRFHDMMSFSMPAGCLVASAMCNTIIAQILQVCVLAMDCVCWAKKSSNSSRPHVSKSAYAFSRKSEQNFVGAFPISRISMHATDDFNSPLRAAWPAKEHSLMHLAGLPVHSDSIGTALQSLTVRDPTPWPSCPFSR